MDVLILKYRIILDSNVDIVCVFYDYSHWYLLPELHYWIVWPFIPYLSSSVTVYYSVLGGSFSVTRSGLIWQGVSPAFQCLQWGTSPDLSISHMWRLKLLSFIWLLFRKPICHTDASFCLSASYSRTSSSAIRYLKLFSLCMAYMCASMENPIERVQGKPSTQVNL